MKKISSKGTFFSKRIFPLIWYGGWGAIFVSGAVSMFRTGKFNFPFLLIGAAGLVFGYFVLKRLVGDVVDEVWDDGNTLVARNIDIVRRKKIEATIPLSNIRNVSYSTSNPPKVTLNLYEPCSLGADVIFSPTTSAWRPFKKSPLVLDLIERIDSVKGDHQIKSL